MGSPARRPAPVRPARHPDPRPGARAHLLGPLRPADRRCLPQVVPAPAPLERRVPVREVLAGRGRAARSSRRNCRSGASIGTSSAWRLRAPWRSAIGCSRSRHAWLWIGGRDPRHLRRGAAAATRSSTRYADRMPELLEEQVRRAGDGPGRIPIRHRPGLVPWPLAASLAPAVAPDVRAAAPDLTLISDTRYDVDPDNGLIHVTRPSRRSITSRTRRPGSTTSIAPTSRSSRARPASRSAPGPAPRGSASSSKKADHNLLRIDFGGRLPAGSVADVHPHLRHPGPGRRPDP